MIYIGIDPGKSGAIAYLHEGCAGVQLLNRTERDIWIYLTDLSHDAARDRIEIFAYIEKVAAMPKQGVTSTFNFGMSYGALRMALIAAEIPFETVAPGVWQKQFGLPTVKQCGGNLTVKKNAHKARAQELFPAIKITHGNADALLIAEYCRRKKGGLDAS